MEALVPEVERSDELHIALGPRNTRRPSTGELDDLRPRIARRQPTPGHDHAFVGQRRFERAAPSIIDADGEDQPSLVQPLGHPPGNEPLGPIEASWVVRSGSDQVPPPLFQTPHCPMMPAFIAVRHHELINTLFRRFPRRNHHCYRERGSNELSMADVINLNRARKRKRREAKLEQAERNRVKHGRTKLEKQLAEREQKRAAEHHAGHERQVDAPNDPEAQK